MRYGVIGIIFIWFMWQYYKMDKSYVYKLHKIKGNSGENVICNILSGLNSEYEVEYDIRIGKTQIDHLVIYKKYKTVFVIETKRWSGKIVGRLSDDKWKQVLRGEVHWYRNPIKQNEYHISKLKNKYVGYKMINVVVFVNNDNIPKLKNVVSQDELYNFIVEYNK